MGKKNRNIIIWILSWALLFLVVAYSPIGRPDLYIGSTSYYSYNQGVNFKGEIANAPTTKSTTIQTNEAETEPAIYTPLDGNEVSYEGSTSKFSTQNASGTVIQDNKSTNNNQQSTDGIALGFSATKQQAQGKATAQNGDVSSLNSSLTLNSTATTSTRQNAPVTRPDGGGTDIGGDPIEQPIPVGNEWWLLLIMAGAYAFWKQRRL